MGVVKGSKLTLLFDKCNDGETGSLRVSTFRHQAATRFGPLSFVLCPLSFVPTPYFPLPPFRLADDTIHIRAPNEGGPMKVVDPVCKMTIDSDKAVATSEHKGQTIYFCAKGCKIAFDKDPEKFMGK
jgi:YHS domain-containing protein